MQDWLKTLGPLLGVIVGWILAEGSKRYTNRVQDKRKLKKLLFYLLDIRHFVLQRTSIDKELSRFITTLEQKLHERVGSRVELPKDQLRLILQPILEKLVRQDPTIDFLEAKIDEVLIEVAEVLPLLAYHLSGQHKIKERLQKVDSYYSEIEAVLAEQLPSSIKQTLQPQLYNELLKELDKNLLDIAYQIGRREQREVAKKISNLIELNNKELNAFLDESLDNTLIQIMQQYSTTRQELDPLG
jgi:hypothetical protein